MLLFLRQLVELLQWLKNDFPLVCLLVLLLALKSWSSALQRWGKNR